MRWQLQQSCRMRRGGLYLLGSVSHSHVSPRWRDPETCTHPTNYPSNKSSSLAVWFAGRSKHSCTRGLIMEANNTPSRVSSWAWMALKPDFPRRELFLHTLLHHLSVRCHVVFACNSRLFRYPLITFLAKPSPWPHVCKRQMYRGPRDRTPLPRRIRRDSSFGRENIRTTTITSQTKWSI
jgi:hypothetical protein